MKRLKALLASTFLVLASAAQAQSTPTISTTDATVAGLNTASALQNAATSTYFSNTGETLLVVKGGGTAVTGTINTVATAINTQSYGPVALTSPSFSVPSGSVVIVGPFQTGRYNNQYGLVGVSFTGVTGVSVSAVNVPQ